MTTVNNVTTTERLNQVLPNGKTNDDFVNSVLTVQGGQTTVGQPQIVSNSDKLLEKLCAEFSNLGIRPAELKNKGILQKVSGLNETQIEKLNQAELDKIYNCLKIAIKDSIKDKKTDLDTVGKLANNYNIALKTGWSIEGFKKYNNNVKKSTLFERMQETGCIPKGAKFEDLSTDELKAGIKKFFEDTLLGNIRNAKTPQEKEKVYKQQLQTFGRLLINSPEKEKTLFIEVSKSLYSEVRLDGFKAVIQSCEQNSTRIDCLMAADDPEFKKAFTANGVSDAEGNVVDENVITQEEAVEFQTIISEGLPKSRLEESHRRDHRIRVEWFEQNREALAAIKEKLDNNGNNEKDLTPDERKLLTEYRNYIVAGQSGELIGASMNNNFTSESEKEEFLKGLNKDNYSLDSYKDVLNLTDDFIKNNPEALTISADNLTKILDNATDGNYSIIANGLSQELKAPSSSEAVSASATNSDGSFVLPENTERLIAETLEKVSQLKEEMGDTTPKNNNFTVEANDKKSYTRVEYAINDGAGYNDIKSNFSLATIARYYRNFTSSYDKKALAEAVAANRNRAQIVNAGGNSLAVAVSAIKKFSEDEIDKLKYISGIVKNAIGCDEDKNAPLMG